jgi:hypothetical protein
MGELQNKIAELIKDVAADRMPIIFCINQEPRLIGTMTATHDMTFIKHVTDTLLIDNRLCASYVSRNTLMKLDRTIILAHA